MGASEGCLLYKLLFFSRSVMSDSLRPHGLQQASLPFTISWSLFNQTHVHRVGDAIQPIYKLRKAKE